MTLPFDGLLFDLEGVLVTGGSPLPGAVGTLNRLVSEGIPFQILSNMTLQPRIAVLDRFRSWGLDLALDKILTPPAAAARWLIDNGNPATVLFVNPPALVEFAGVDVLPEEAAEAEWIVIGDMSDAWDSSRLNRALRLLLRGARPIALGMGRYWNAPDGLRLDVGAFATALAFASGQEPLVIGKPAPAYFRMALDLLAVPAGRVAMVGDDILNDVQGAQQAGLRAILVRTGKFRPNDLERGVVPEWVVPDVRGVLPLLGLE